LVTIFSDNRKNGLSERLSESPYFFPDSEILKTRKCTISSLFVLECLIFQGVSDRSTRKIGETPYKFPHSEDKKVEPSEGIFEKQEYYSIFDTPKRLFFRIVVRENNQLRGFTLITR
jgi:hypothetical protein